ADILGVLYGELMKEDVIISPRGRVEDGSGQLLHNWTDGMPGKFRFTLPRGQTSFVIRSSHGDIVQDITGAVD
ncbi:hypothetical protein, partial [Salmonella sp. SAL4433]|uniref:hypothetical protein n=1 Tax=Salmonella sp. SAL4433 TaxID=3159888 RepID=UPI00397DF58B